MGTVTEAGTDKAQRASRLVNLVGLLELVSAGFWALVALLMFGIAVVLAWAAHAGHPIGAQSPWTWFGIGCFFLAWALVCLGAGLGLRQRLNWARRLTGWLCYLGAFTGIAFYGLLFWRLSVMAPGNPVADVIKMVFGGITAVWVVLLIWIANRLNRAALIAEFRALPAGEDETIQS